MKKQLLFMAIAGLFTSMASATDLYVRDAGAGGAYPTISAAISAAVDGDRIIIRPKSAGLPYIENLTIDKSLSFVSETNFSKYLVQGSVSVTASAGRMVTINNMSTTSDVIVTAATTGGRTTLSLYNSLFGNVTADKANTSLNMSGCTVGIVAITHGRITGNTCSVITLNGTTIESNPAADPIEIIANNITTSSNAISCNQKNYALRILNNYIGSGSMYFGAAKTGSTNEVRNNVVNNGSYSAIYITLTTGNGATFYVLNNVLTTSTTLTNYAEVHNDSAPSATVYAMNNASISAFTTIGATVATGNIGMATISFNSATCTATGTVLVNGGTADDDYADIDLSRNDIGNWGGSDTWANYWPTAVGNKPQVNYLNTPRRIYTGTTEMNATGSGYTK